VHHCHLNFSPCFLTALILNCVFIQQFWFFTMIFFFPGRLYVCSVLFMGKTLSTEELNEILDWVYYYKNMNFSNICIFQRSVLISNKICKMNNKKKEINILTWFFYYCCCCCCYFSLARIYGSLIYQARTIMFLKHQNSLLNKNAYFQLVSLKNTLVKQTS